MPGVERLLRYLRANFSVTVTHLYVTQKDSSYLSARLRRSIQNDAQLGRKTLIDSKLSRHYVRRLPKAMVDMDAFLYVVVERRWADKSAVCSDVWYGWARAEE